MEFSYHNHYYDSLILIFRFKTKFEHSLMIKCICKLANIDTK